MLEIQEIPSTINSNDSQQPSEDNILKILIATDVHLGYCEKDSIRGNDSFNTFEEILQHAVNNDVDFLLLGGDLFHQSKPSTICYHKCISLLKKYCLGDKPVAVEFMSDQSRNFGHLKNPVVNYEDPNLNVSIPVFSIHGNHDDPTGESNLSAMDILADTGLVNYFGKWTDLTKIEVYPLLMKKGATQLALYGLSHIKDERLSRLFKDKKVTMTRPLDCKNWFNILVLHQNRAQNRGLKNFIPESVLPEFVDLVLWGHEHDCRIDPEDSINGAFITQPGSSVATSLAIGESLPKYCGLLHIDKERFRLEKIKLNTVRPFIFKEITLSKPTHYEEASGTEYAKNQIQEVIEKMLIEAETILTPVSPKLPLLRLVVNFTDETLMSNAIRMGQTYCDKVANPIEMLSFKVKKSVSVRNRNQIDELDDIEELTSDQLTENISDLVDHYFETKNQTLNILTTKGLCEAVSRFIHKDDGDAIDDIIKHQYNKTLQKLLNIDDITDENYQELLENFRVDREVKPNDEIEEIENLFNDVNRVPNRAEDVAAISSDDETSGPSVKTVKTPKGNTSARDSTSGRPARGRGSRGPRRTKAKAT